MPSRSTRPKTTRLAPKARSVLMTITPNSGPVGKGVEVGESGRGVDVAELVTGAVAADDVQAASNNTSRPLINITSLALSMRITQVHSPCCRITRHPG